MAILLKAISELVLYWKYAEFNVDIIWINLSQDYFAP